MFGAQAINGDTLIFATPGDPVSQMRLPLVMGPVFAALAVNAVWLPLHVDKAGLSLVLQALRAVRNFRGITVAIPYKPRVARMVDRLSRRAAAAGCVNLVRLDPDGSLFGDMADGAGFVRGLELCGHSAEGAKVWLVGAGGAGAAIAAALAEAQVARLYITEIERERGLAVVERLRSHYRDVPIELVATPPEPVDIAVNATPCGLRAGDPLPFDPAALSRETLVCDIIMKPKETPLLAAAAALGMRSHHGHHTLDTQIPMYLRFFGFPVGEERAIIELASRIAA
ncbi:MAG: shikimate dehydrogenase family protein [Alphaproteobacteria bacterium]